MSTSIKFNGTEVKNPVVRIFAVPAIMGAFFLVMTFGFVMIQMILCFIVLAFIVTVPIHFILRLCGHRGIYVHQNVRRTWANTGAFRHR